MTITRFLEARIAEDEAFAAQAAGDQYGWVDSWVADAKGGAHTSGLISFHALRHDPARVLAECAAKRAVIKQADEASSDRSQVISEFCVGQAERDAEYATDPGALILKALATVYADHPDYQQDWAL